MTTVVIDEYIDATRSFCFGHAFTFQGPEGYPAGRKSLGNALRTRGGITRPGRPDPSELSDGEPPMGHAETAPVLDRNITEPLPAVEEEDHDRPFSPLMTPKAAENRAQAGFTAENDVVPLENEKTTEPQPKEDFEQDLDVEGTAAPEELAEEGWLS